MPYTDDEDLECACVQVDVDLNDAAGCPVHQHGGTMDRWLWQRAAALEAAFWTPKQEEASVELDACPF